MKAVILAGGLGRRLRPLTDNTPKPLLKISAKPIIVWQIEWLKRHGINEIVICAGYLREKIIRELGNGCKYNVKIGYVVEDTPLGTGGAIKNAEIFLRNEEGFYVLNGDILTDLNPKRLRDIGKKYVGAIALVQLKSPYGIVETREDEIVRFREKPVIEEYWINAGIYYFKPEIFKYLPEKGDIEKETFPKLAEKGLLKAVKYENIFWKSIDTHKDLQEAEKYMGVNRYG